VQTARPRLLQLSVATVVPCASDFRERGGYNTVEVAAATMLTIGKVDTEDIEDLCKVCDPIPLSEGFDAPSVTSYPMKIERKKQREELNIVSVVEWRNDDDRWFLLSRRPEGGASQTSHLE
jgi:hypothetical protein